MPRKKRENPVTGMPSDMPVIPVTPILGEPGVFQLEPQDNKPSNVVQFRESDQPINTERDWSSIDAILSDVVSFT